MFGRIFVKFSFQLPDDVTQTSWGQISKVSLRGLIHAFNLKTRMLPETIIISLRVDSASVIHHISTKLKDDTLFSSGYRKGGHSDGRHVQGDRSAQGRLLSSFGPTERAQAGPRLSSTA
jgi:hypothetical protein